MNNYQALVINSNENGASLDYEDRNFKELVDGEVRVRIYFSSINFKDRLAVNPTTKVIRSFPMVPGIDFSGVVAESSAEGFEEGDMVVVTGYGFGTDFDGGFREYAEVHRSRLVKLDPMLSLEEAMVYGTAGFTAALSVDAIVKKGITPDRGKILVTGGTGGVGSHAIAILKKLGYTVVAAARNLDREDFLKSLGADEVILFDEVMPPKKPLAPIRWASAIDATGGESVSSIVSEVDNEGVVALSGNASGAKFTSTVFPFILRGVSLVGINSVLVDNAKREEIWAKLGEEWKSDRLSILVRNRVAFSDLKENLLTEPKGPGRDLVIL
ncbi:MAG TPA: acryloyl-CoA reductase [Clostridiaceae bacterium]|nr:acryloyl-CoA reductase [Clostridiaceae bacterium]